MRAHSKIAFMQVYIRLQAFQGHVNNELKYCLIVPYAEYWPITQIHSDSMRQHMHVKGCVHPHYPQLLLTLYLISTQAGVILNFSSNALNCI